MVGEWVSSLLKYISERSIGVWPVFFLKGFCLWLEKLSIWLKFIFDRVLGAVANPKTSESGGGGVVKKHEI